MNMFLEGLCLSNACPIALRQKVGWRLCEIRDNLFLRYLQSHSELQPRCLSIVLSVFAVFSNKAPSLTILVDVLLIWLRKIAFACFILPSTCAYPSKHRYIYSPTKNSYQSSTTERCDEDGAHTWWLVYTYSSRLLSISWSEMMAVHFQYLDRWLAGRVWVLF